jgi:hypothetical protein
MARRPRRNARVAVATAVVAPLAILALLASPVAAAQCARVVDVERELPHDVDTPRGNRLSYSYDLASERYYVIATRGEADGVPHGPYSLTRGCAPAALEWENGELVVLTAGCGTFCWEALVLPVTGTAAAQSIARPLLFDAERNLLAYYPEPNLVRIRNLLTGREQSIRTPQCVSASATCIAEMRFTASSFDYTFERFDPPSAPSTLEPLSVPLDASLSSR